MTEIGNRTRGDDRIAGGRQVDILITQGLQSWKEQDALFAKGRTAAPLGHDHIVTNARGGQSYHNFGGGGRRGMLRADWLRFGSKLGDRCGADTLSTLQHNGDHDFVSAVAKT